MHDSQMQANPLNELSDLIRRFHNVIKIGSIFEVDLAAKKVRIELEDELITGFIDMPGEVAKNFTRWRPLDIGTKVMLACESGDLRNAAIIQIFYSDSRPSPSDIESLDIIQFIDGAELAYDTDSHEMTIKLPPGGVINATCDGGLNIVGDLKVTGDINASGDVSDSAASMAVDRVKYNVHVHASNGVPPTPQQ